MGYIALSGTFVNDTFPNFIKLQDWSTANLKFFPNAHINVYMKITYLDHVSQLSITGMFRAHEKLIKNNEFTATYFWYYPG
jgi:hypothetical protein